MARAALAATWALARTAIYAGVIHHAVVSLADRIARLIYTGPPR